jgi:ATP-dependent helicase/DNAse subunit B
LELNSTVNASLVIGPAASGKTQACVEAIRGLAVKDAIAPVWALLPDRAQSVAFRTRLAAAGGAIGARVETMDALVEEILMRAGEPRPRANKLVARRLIGQLLTDMARRGALEHYGPIADSIGLTRSLQARIEELTRAAVKPDDLAHFAQTQGNAGLSDIARVFAEYQERLASYGWDDAGGPVAKAAGHLEQDPDLLADIRLIVLDGFEGYQRTQLALLAALAGAADLMITLTGDTHRERLAFTRFEATRRDLIEHVPGLRQIDVEGAVPLPTALRALERRVFEPWDAVEVSDRVSFLRTRSRQQEIREALRWLKARIVRDGCSPTDCALLLSDPEQDVVVARETAREFGMPIRFRHGLPLLKAPAVVALLDLLDSSRLDWPRRLTLEAVRAPYMNLEPFGLNSKDAISLEAASYWGQVVSGVEQWEDALSRLARRSETDEGEEMAISGAALPPPATSEQLLAGVRSLVDRLAPPAAQSVHEWVRWLEDLLDDLAFFDALQTADEQAAFLRLREVLRALVLAELAVGEDRKDFSEFLSDLRSSIESARYQPRLDWRQAAVQVMATDSAAGLRFEAVAVVGLSEGQLPKVERADPFLDESVRHAVGLEPRLGRQQSGTFYHAISRANAYLLLTRATLADDGESWHPSPYWTAALAVFGLEDEQVDSVRPGEPRPLSEACSPQEVSFLAVRRLSLPASCEPVAHRLDPLRRSRVVLAARSQSKAAGPFEGDLGTESEILSEIFSERRVWSPSRLESYTSCPHLFYVAQLLGVESLEPPTLGPDPRQLGSLLHAVLEQAYKTAEDSTDVDSVLTRLREIAGEALAAAPAAYGFRPSPLWDIESHQFALALERTVEALAEEGTGWRPFAFEQRFGLDGRQPLVIETAQGQVQVRGIVDRLDRRDSELRVIDYKTGSSHLSAGDLIDGRRLQLPLYALAAERALELGEVVDGFYWAILSARRGSLRLASFRDPSAASDMSGPAAAYQRLISHLERFLAGGRQGAFSPVPPAGGCPTYCPAAGWCWRYSPGYRG